MVVDQQLAQRLEQTLGKPDMKEAVKQVRQIRRTHGDDTAAGVVYLVSNGESAGILIYTLITFLLNDEEDILWHKIARDVLSNPLCHYTGAYKSSIVHARRVCELEPEVAENWESLLDIGAGRTELLTKKEVDQVARKLMEIDPENATGKIYINE